MFIVVEIQPITERRHDVGDYSFVKDAGGNVVGMWEQGGHGL